MPCGRSSGADAAAPRNLRWIRHRFSIAVGVHVGGDRQAIDHSIFVPEIFDHTIAPEIPSAINDVSRERFPPPSYERCRFTSVSSFASSLLPKPRSSIRPAWALV